MWGRWNPLVLGGLIGAGIVFVPILLADRLREAAGQPAPVITRPRPVADPGQPLPPFLDPPPAGQTSWPQVDFTKPESLNAFVRAHEGGKLMVNRASPTRPDRTFGGWIAVGNVATRDDGRRFLKVLGDKWVGPDGNENPDGKMPNDRGWDWWLDIDESRVIRLPSETPMTPVRYAEIIIRTD